MTEDVKHPLVEKELSYFQDWPDWRWAWEETKTAEMLYSLLHWGFHISGNKQEQLDRICFYLEIANGHNRDSHNILKTEEEKRNGCGSIWMAFAGRGLIRGTCQNSFGKYQIRQVIAQKAFQELSLNFFKEDGENLEYGEALPLAVNIKLLEKLIGFFRIDGQSWENFVNLDIKSNNIHHRNACAFLVRLCKLALIDNKLPNHWEERDSIAERLKQYQLQFVEMLSGLGKLGLLLNKAQVIDEPILTWLEQLALNTDLYLPKKNKLWSDEYRKPDTLEEAFLGGSQAAKVLILLRIKNTEKVRQGKIKEADRQKRKAELALAELQT